MLAPNPLTRRNRISWLAAAILAAAAAIAPGRTWTDRTEKEHLDAELVDVNILGTVFLNQGGPVDLKIPITQFSKADQRYIQEEVGRRRTALETHLARGPGIVSYGPARKLATLANPSVVASSGIACSRRQPGVFWTHNDAGDEARLYAFDQSGRDLGSCLLEGVAAFDWEDIASCTLEGKSCLLVGEIGNNSRGAGVQILYLVEEPPIDRQLKTASIKVPVVQTIHYAYEDDHHDCEALGVDPVTRTILVVSKERWPPSYVYVVPWPQGNTKKAVTARRIASLPFPLVTAMDVSPDGRRAVVGTYRNAYEFHRGPDEDWATAFARKPIEIVLPPRVQGEGLCFGPDGKALYLTDEVPSPPLWEIPAKR